MAQRRMFSLHVIDTDKFLDMSSSAQALYFHLGLHGDDDGFVSAPKKIARAVGCNDDDLRLLATKGFVIPFSSGVVVITDWKINNTLKNDRYHETVYHAEKAMLCEDESGRYLIGTIPEPDCLQDGTSTEPELNRTELNRTEHNIDKADKPPRARFSPPSLEEVTAYCKERGNKVDPQRFIDYYTANGWKVGRSKMSDWKAAVRTWERNDLDKPSKGKSAERDYTAPPGFDFL